MIQYSTRIYDILLLKFKYNPSYLSLIKVSEKKNEGTIIRAYISNDKIAGMTVQ